MKSLINSIGTYCLLQIGDNEHVNYTQGNGKGIEPGQDQQVGPTHMPLGKLKDFELELD